MFMYVQITKDNKSTRFQTNKYKKHQKQKQKHKLENLPWHQPFIFCFHCNKSPSQGQTQKKTQQNNKLLLYKTMQTNSSEMTTKTQCHLQMVYNQNTLTLTK